MPAPGLHNNYNCRERWVATITDRICRQQQQPFSSLREDRVKTSERSVCYSYNCARLFIVTLPILLHYPLLSGLIILGKNPYAMSRWSFFFPLLLWLYIQSRLAILNRRPMEMRVVVAFRMNVWSNSPFELADLSAAAFFLSRRRRGVIYARNSFF